MLTGIGVICVPERILEIESDEEYVAELIQSDSELKKIKRLIIEDHAEVADEYAYEIYRYSFCKDFFDRFHFKLITENTTYEVTHECPKCKVKIHPINRYAQKDQNNSASQIDFDQYPCPNCGAYHTFLTNFLLYDQTAFLNRHTKMRNILFFFKNK